MKHCLALQIGALLAASSMYFPAHAALHRVGKSSADASSPTAVWVYFIDKPNGGSMEIAASSHALARRRAAGYRPDNAVDQPVSQFHVREIERMGGKLRCCFKWENAASFDLPAGNIPLVADLPYVKLVTLVGSSRRKAGTIPKSLGKRKSSPSGIYGEAFDQLSLLNIPRAHEYISRRFGSVAPGSGISIAFFDSGFRLRHRCFRNLLTRNAIIATHDFVDGDTTVEDPDSVFNNDDHPYNVNDEHGSQVLSIVASYDPPYYCGTAWGADFLLVRTEDSYTYSNGSSREVHAEEDNWAAAVVWAESLGVDIISSSVAYRSGFEDSVVIDRGDGRFDTIVSYAKSDLDGKTTIISQAAREAVARGVIIVNSIGNEGDEGDTSLDAPADVDGVVAVGSTTVDGYIDSDGSRGPSADGRTKPDVVAPGAGVYMPDVYHYESTGIAGGWGTSYAAPFIAGICALIKQCDTTLDAAAVRKELYRFCRPPRGPAAMDNRWYGRGIPDAQLSCMRPGEAYLTAIDTGGRPLSDAVIESEGGDTLARFDASGITFVTLPSGSTDGVVIRKGVDRRVVPFDSTPCRVVLYPCTLDVKVRNEKSHVIPYATLMGTVGADDYLQRTDDLGNLSIVSFFNLPITLAVSQDGYLTSDTLNLSLIDLKQERTVQLKPSAETTVSLYPTVIRRSRAERLHFRCSVPLGEPAKTLEVFIRSITGELILHESYSINPPVANVEWDCNSKKASVSPGTYFAMFLFDGKKQREKIIVAP